MRLPVTRSLGEIIYSTVKRALVASVLIATSTALALVVSELLVRAIDPQKLSLNVTRWDPDVGFSHIPGAQGYGETEDYKMYIRINSRGLRDREFSLSKPAGTIRIGILDSFTFGEGVASDETYPKVLERLLAADPALRAAGLRVEVLNFGIGKTGTSHQLAWYRKEGRKYGLDIVITGLFANDIDDN